MPDAHYKKSRQSGLSERALARQYGISRETVRKWKSREGPHDLSSIPHNLRAVLSPEQEIIAVELRKTLLLPLDDLLVLVREFINPSVSRSGLDRCLRRYGVSNLSELKKSMTDENQPEKEKKTFKDYEPGFVHVDVKYLPQMPDEAGRSYLFVAIDHATRWVYFEILPDKSASSSRSFMKRLIKKAPFNIKKVLTDNGKEFTDRFSCTGERQPSGRHEFDKVCLENGIEHRLIRPRHPQTNGMVERFNGRIEEIISQTRFNSAKELEDTLNHYLRIYNNQIPQKALGYISHVQALVHQISMIVSL
jgi:transposase-like protein